MRESFAPELIGGGRWLDGVAKVPDGEVPGLVQKIQMDQEERYPVMEDLFQKYETNPEHQTIQTPLFGLLELERQAADEFPHQTKISAHGPQIPDLQAGSLHEIPEGEAGEPIEIVRRLVNTAMEGTRQIKRPTRLEDPRELFQKLQGLANMLQDLDVDDGIHAIIPESRSHQIRHHVHLPVILTFNLAEVRGNVPLT
jgi:hypothetical protein